MLCGGRRLRKCNVGDVESLIVDCIYELAGHQYWLQENPIVSGHSSPNPARLWILLAKTLRTVLPLIFPLEFAEQTENLLYMVFS